MRVFRGDGRKRGSLRASNTQFCKSASLKNHIRYRTGIWIASGHDRNFRTLLPLTFRGPYVRVKYSIVFAVVF